MSAPPPAAGSPVPSVLVPVPAPDAGTQTILFAILVAVAIVLLALVIFLVCVWRRQARRAPFSLGSDSIEEPLLVKAYPETSSPPTSPSIRTAASDPAPLAPKEYTRTQKLGCGSYGEVWQCLRKNGTFFALKIIDIKDAMSPTDVTKLMEEVRLMSELRSQYIVQYYGATYNEETHRLHVYMEYVEGGSLGAMVRRLREPLHEDAARQYMRMIIDGVAFLHAENVIHRDLKGDNILVSNGLVKLADFGTSRKARDLHNMSLRASTIIGTPLWMAPEVIRADGYGTPADIWSLGCVLVEILNRGKPVWHPFDNQFQAMMTIGQWAKPLPPNIPESLSDPCLELLRACLNPNPAKRPTAEQLQSFPFICQEISLSVIQQDDLEEIELQITHRLGGDDDDDDDVELPSVGLGGKHGATLLQPHLLGGPNPMLQPSRAAVL
eukprot:Sspe_Gene.116776::Locus_106519_Transcript_1_1_Confidence_1.000_Length_1470::g.116776::m.116776